MNEKVVVDQLKRLVPQGRFQMEGDVCCGVHLADEKHVWHGFARHSQDKHAILRLISKLENLKYLDLRKNCFGPLPDLGLQNLEYADLASNYMRSVPEWLQKCPLKYLNLGVNELTDIPDWFANLTNLTVLKLHKNEIKNTEAVSNLTFLNLYFNRMKSIPKFVWTLDQLEFFSWGISSIGTLPGEIGNLNKLKWLSMVGNKLTELPDEFCLLKNLIGIRLHKNRLHKLPESIGNLEKLEQITLYHNRLKSLPDSFYKLKLKKLNLAHNEFKIPPQIKADWMCYETSDCIWHE